MITLEQAKSLKKGDFVYETEYGNWVRKWKVNGKVKTWKRTPSRIYVPLKFGLYTLSSLTEIDLNEFFLTDPKLENKS